MTEVLERETTGSTLERPVETTQPPVEVPPRPELPAPRRPYVRWLGWMLVVAVIAVAGILVAIQSDEVVLDDGSFEANELARMLRLAPIDTSFAASEFAADAALSHVRPWMSTPGAYDGSFAAITFANDAYVSHLRPWMDALTPSQVTDASMAMLTANIAKAFSFEASFPTLDIPGLDTAFEVDALLPVLKANIEKTFSYEASFGKIDTSFETNELARMLTLAPTIDTSFETNELARMLTLAPTIDTSFETNELARMLALAPTIDTSFEANELARMLALAPTIDTSFEANELARMLTLAPEVSDGSFEANELARMLRLAPQIDTSFDTNELARMLELEPEA